MANRKAGAGARIRVSRFRWWRLKRILEIERASFAHEAYTREMFLELYRECGDLFLVARRQRRIVGYMVTCARGGRAEIVSIAVEPESRQLGVGKALMQHTLARLQERGVARLYLMVRPANTAGISFYRSFGFVGAGRVAHYYEDGGDGWRMKKVLGMAGAASARPGSARARRG